MAKPGRGEWEQFRKVAWVKPSVLALTSDAKTLYFWSWTHPNSALSGLEEVSPGKLLRQLGPPPLWAGEIEPSVRLATALDELAHKPLLLYDADTELMWVVGRVEHALKSPTQAVRMQREFEAAPSCQLKDRFAEVYGARILQMAGRREEGGEA